MRYLSLIFLFIVCASLQPRKEAAPYVLILGIAQDAGYPQAGCEKACCKKVLEGKAIPEMVASIAIVDPVSHQKWIIDATPDITKQMAFLNKYEQGPLSGVFLTHAHIGHYTGLMYFGREAMNTDRLPVFAMPRMKTFLSTNGPWSQLVSLKNILINDLREDSIIVLNERISVQPLIVPHRDEFSETVGFLITMNKKRVLYIPDIDKWNKWKQDIAGFFEEGKGAPLLVIDGTFYKDGEIPGRNMAEIPHPFVEETMRLLNNRTAAEKRNIYFTHFNHTNPLLDSQSNEAKEVKANGFNLARTGLIIRP